MARIRRFYLRRRVTPFVILFVERSGSTHLATLLASHPEVLALREQFSVLKQQGVEGDAQLAWAREFLTPPLLGRHAARGFKTKLVDIPDSDRFREILADTDCRIVELKRRNTVKGAVSTINARRLYESTGNWNLLNRSDKQSAFEVDLEELDKLIQQREQWDQELSDYVERADRPTLSISYEDLLADEETVLASIFEFLGVSAHPLEKTINKHTSDDLSEVLVNFGDVLERYRGTQYQSMLCEGMPA